MTPAQSLRLRGFNAAIRHRGVALSITPGDGECVGLVETVDERSRARFKNLDVTVTHVIHILRSLLKTVFETPDETTLIVSGAGDAVDGTYLWNGASFVSETQSAYDIYQDGATWVLRESGSAAYRSATSDVTGAWNVNEGEDAGEEPAPTVAFAPTTDAETFKDYLKLISEFTRADDGSSYRVTFLDDDPQRPAVMFHCVTV